MNTLSAKTARSMCFLMLFAVCTPALALLPGIESKNGLPSFSSLLDKIKPAVVNISAPSHEFAEGSPLKDDPFYKHFLEPRENAPAPPYVSVGSGVIVDARQGHILTNQHVVAGIEEIIVTLEDQRRFRAKLIGSDPDTDIALLEIRADKLTALKLGDSDRLEVGDFVLAIGNPFGLGQTVTSGIISGLGRSGLGIEGYEDFIQTDASINPGNSGGPLVNLAGELVGINTAILAPEGGNVGISFAIPTNMARAIMEQLLQYGEVRRGRIGVSLQDLTPELAAALGVSAGAGAVLAQVISNTPAAQAGLQLGDVVLAINGRLVRGSADLRNQIGLMRIGSQVELEVLHNGAIQSIKLPIVDEAALPPASGKSVVRLEGASLLDTQPCTPIFGDLAGVLVLSVEPTSAAARYGLQQGDIIVAINRDPVRSVADLKKTLQGSNRAVALNLIRDNQGVFIVIEQRRH